MNPLQKKAGKRQIKILVEFQKRGIITYDKERNLWVRGALSTRFAKDLLNKNDKTIADEIAELEPFVLRLERQAASHGVELKGTARQKLNGLYEILKTLNNDCRKH